jgi:type II secretory pathway component PulF
VTIYTYKGFQEKRVVRGIMEASTSRELLEKLSTKRIHVIWYYPKKLTTFKRLSFQDSLTLCTHLEYFLKAGFSLPTALHYVSEQSSYSLRQIMILIQQKVAGGFTLSEAIHSEKNIFDPIFIELIKVGETNGNLGQSFGQIKDYLIWKNKFQKTLVQSLRYPLILSFLLIILVITLTTFLIPPLKSFLTTTAIEQTTSTHLILGFTDFVSTYGSLMILGIGLISIILFFLTRFKTTRFIWNKTLTKLPFLGPFLIKLWMIKISMNLSLLLKSEIFLIQALQIANTQTNNLYLKSILERVKAQLIKGHPISDSFSVIKTIPPLVSHFIKAGEQTNNLAESFLTVRDYYSETLQHQIDLLRDFLPTICLLFIGGFLIWIVLGIFYPLYNLSGI